MPNQNRSIIVDWFYMVAILCSNELFARALKLKNINCGKNSLIWVKLYTYINNVLQYG